MRVRWGIGAGASVLLSAGVLGIGGSLTPDFLHASATPLQSSSLIAARAEPRLEVIDMSTSTVWQVIEALPKAQRFELMLYNSGAGDALKRRGTYTVFVPASAYFDYLPKRYIAGLTRTQTKSLALSHVVDRALPVEESLNGTVHTLGGTLVHFEVDVSAQEITIGDARVIKAYQAQNGMVYLIDKVLVPAG